MKKNKIIAFKVLLLSTTSVFISAFSNYSNTVKITEDVIKSEHNFDDYEIEESISPTLNPSPLLTPSPSNTKPKPSSSVSPLPIKPKSSILSVPSPSISPHSNKNNIVKFSWIKPIEGTIPNPFGNGYHFYGSYRAGHTGIDINAKVGTPVKAVADGIVRYIKPKNNLRYGLYVVIEHENKLFSLSGHLSKIGVKLKQKVKQGDIIGFSGVSGLASYPHIHFEVIDRIPIRDGAYGYNYICTHRKFKVEPKEEQQKKFLSNKPPIYDLLPLSKVIEEFSFLNQDKKEMDKFYRMKSGHCVEVKLPKIVYYNPENFFSSFEKAEMPEFKLLKKRIVSIKRKSLLKNQKV